MKRNLVLLGLSVWWFAASIILAFQAYVMTKSVVITFIATILAIIIAIGNLWLEKKLRQKKKYARVICYVYIFLHFIPILMQFIYIKSAGFDNILAALIGLLLLISINQNQYS